MFTTLLVEMLSQLHGDLLLDFLHCVQRIVVDVAVDVVVGNEVGKKTMTEGVFRCWWWWWYHYLYYLYCCVPGSES